MKSNIIRNIVVLLLVVIAAEATYLGYLKFGVSKLRQVVSSSAAQKITPTPTVSTIQVLDDGSSAFVFEGKVKLLEEMQDEKYKSRMKIMKDDGTLENIQFEKTDFDIMTVTKTDVATGEEREVTYSDIHLDDHIRMKLLFDPVEQSKADNKIENYKIIINIL